MVEFSADETTELVRGNAQVLEWLQKELKFEEEPWPETIRIEEEGQALAKAYPILGVEKYLGMWDSQQKLAYFPSLKLTHDSVITQSFAKFDKSLKEDVIIIGDKAAEGKELKRIQNIVGVFRRLTGAKTPLLFISKHFPKTPTKGKGLGMSAAAGAATAKALIEAIAPQVKDNNRFLNVVSRHLSGSSTSSAAGHYSVWLSCPTIKSQDSYAVRVREKVSQRLVIVPIPASLKTSEGHEAAVQSPLYKYWALNKANNVIDVMEAIKQDDLAKIGRHFELDGLNLFHLMVSGGNMFNWEKDTLAVMRKVVQMRTEEKIECYYTSDTGPSVAILTRSQDAELVKDRINEFTQKELGKVFDTFIAEPAGRPERLKEKDLSILLTDSVQQILTSKQIEI